MHANKADEMASLGQLQQQLRDINNKKDRMEKCIHSG
jgi:TolA-binding protein